MRKFVHSETASGAAVHEVGRIVATAVSEGRPDVFFGKRRWLRHQLGMRLEVVYDENGTAAPTQVIMHNVSGGGFAFWSQESFETGRHVQVREWTADGAGLWLGARVVNCTLGIGGHLVGAAFDHPVEPDSPDVKLSVEDVRPAAPASRPRPPMLSLPAKSALAAALGGALGVGGAAALSRYMPAATWLLWLPLVSAGLALVGGLLTGRAVLSRDAAYLRALGRAAREIADGEPPPLAQSQAPSRELETLREALADVQLRWSKRAHDEKSQRQRLEELNLVKSNILNVVSHDLRTPLTSILLYAEMLREELTSLAEEDQRRFLKIISDECNRLSRLVDDLLEAQRLESGRARWDIKAHDLAPTIRACTIVFQAMANSKSIELTAQCPERLPAVEVDVDKIAQVISNLLSNALKYTPAGGKVRLTAEATGAEILIRVADNGPGIRRDEWDKIFDRFSRASASYVGEITGVGLGLYIVRQIVERHAGRVWVDSQVGVGAEFCVSLPMRSTALPAFDDGSPPRGRVVVCDADPELATRIAQALRQRRYDVHMAHCGARLLAQLAAAETDVVVTDVLVPDMPAAELLDALTGEPYRRYGLVLHSYATELQALCRPRVEAVLQRPARIAELIAVVDRLIERRRHPRMCVVLVESDGVESGALSRRLAAHGHTRLRAGTISGAAALMRQQRVDAVLVPAAVLNADWSNLSELCTGSAAGTPRVVVLAEKVRRADQRLAESVGVEVLACPGGAEGTVIDALTAPAERTAARSDT